MQIGDELKGEARQTLINFLRRKADLFLWSPSDMPGISRDVMDHELKVDELQANKTKEEKFSLKTAKTYQ